MSVEPESRARSAIAVGLALTFLGLALVATASKSLGGPVVAVGWAALLYGIHAFGRLGRDA
jgi:hypothetical protein